MIAINFTSQCPIILTWKIILPEKKKDDKTEDSLLYAMSSRPIKCMLSVQHKHSS